MATNKRGGYIKTIRLPAHVVMRMQIRIRELEADLKKLKEQQK